MAKPESTRSSERSALVVLGMHRSGTSAVTRVLSLLGADLPSALMAPVPGVNESGFWESKDLSALNDEILSSGGSSWDDLSPFPKAWYDSTSCRLLRDRVLELLARDFERSPLFVLKDPRICRLVPFWTSTLRAFGAEPRFVHVTRNPLEVAASLKARDEFLPSKSYLLWLRHVLDAERDTRGRRRTFVSYDALLESWRDVVERASGELGISWPRRSHETSAEIEAFLSGRLRHHHSGLSDLEARGDVSRWVKKTYRLLSSREGVERPESLRELDEIRDELAVADHAFGPLVAQARVQSSRRQKVIERLSSELTEEQREVGRLGSVVADQTLTLASHQEALEWLRDAVTHHAEKLEGQRAVLDRLEARVSDETVRPRELFDLTKRFEGRERLALAEPKLPTFGDLWLSSHYGIWGLIVKLPAWLVKGHLKSRLRWWRHARQVLRSGLFDAESYRRRYPDVETSGVDPLYHYVRYGAAQGYAPHPYVEDRRAGGDGSESGDSGDAKRCSGRPSTG